MSSVIEGQTTTPAASIPSPKITSEDLFERVTVNGTRLAYVQEGEGEPVVFVHGGISDLTIWQQQLPVFGEHYRAIAYSRRFAWPNDEIPAGADDQMIPHADDLAEFIRTLDLGRVHLVGNSWGAFICLFVALRNPELVRTLTLEEPPVIPLFVSAKPKLLELAKMFATRPRTGLAMFRFVAKGLKPSEAAFRRGEFADGVRIFANAVLGGEVYDKLPAELKEHMIINGATLKAQLLGEGFPEFTDADARRIECPTLLTTGEKSPHFLLRLTDRLEELLPHAERVEIADASHVMHVENPSATNRAIMDFLARHPR